MSEVLGWNPAGVGTSRRSRSGKPRHLVHSLVFDDESEIDHRFAVTLANIPPYPKIKFEKNPSERTFCSDWRSEGYSRQQYSNFYSDVYTDKEFIGIVDTDSFFVTPVTPKDIFIEGKPRIIGYNGYTSWSESLQRNI